MVEGDRLLFVVSDFGTFLDDILLGKSREVEGNLYGVDFVFQQDGCFYYTRLYIAGVVRYILESKEGLPSLCRMRMAGSK